MTGIGAARIGCIAGLLTVVLAASACLAAPEPAVPGQAAGDCGGDAVRRLPRRPARAGGGRLSRRRLWYEEALKADPRSPELISRTFDMEAQSGRFDKALPLAQKVLDLDGSDAVADLVLLLDRVEAGDNAGALARAEALPDDGLHRYAGPLVLAWTQMAVGEPRRRRCGAARARQVRRLRPPQIFPAGPALRFRRTAGQGRAVLSKTLDVTGQLNWRLTDAMANFYLAPRPSRSGPGDLQALRRRELGQRARRIGDGEQTGWRAGRR